MYYDGNELRERFVADIKRSLTKFVKDESR